MIADFPTSLLDFQRRFADDAACAAWLGKARWPSGFRCPACAHEKGWPHGGKRFTYECANCGKQTSVTAGTIMHASKLPLTVWFWAVYLNGPFVVNPLRSSFAGSLFCPWSTPKTAGRHLMG